ncbi:unnamed protein product, partial [Discosporangium mesarthrocarpum]
LGLGQCEGGLRGGDDPLPEGGRLRWLGLRLCQLGTVGLTGVLRTLSGVGSGGSIGSRGYTREERWRCGPLARCPKHVDLSYNIDNPHADGRTSASSPGGPETGREAVGSALALLEKRGMEG